MDDLEKVANHVSDMDLEWWPFLFLRPTQEEKLGNRRVLALALLYGVFVGMFANVALALMGKKDAVNPFIFPAAATALFFCVYRLTFAFFWNRRAERLARSGESFERD